MLCEICHEKPVTVHMQQIINGEKTEIHVCQDCSSKMQMPISFDNFFQGFLDSFFSANLNSVQVKQGGTNESKCPECNLSYTEFKNTGRLGCSICYSTFRKELNTLFKSIQSSNQHQGKFPRKFGSELLNKRKIEKLRSALSKSIENEEYEEAASIRDQIRGLERELQGEQKDGLA